MKTEWKEKKVPLSGSIIGAAVTLVLGLVVGLNWNHLSTNWGPYLGFSKPKENIDFSELTYLYNEISTYYDGDIDNSKLIEGAKRGLTAALGDRYTEYMTASEASEYKASLEGDISEAGVGIEMAKREDYVKVIRTLPDNPARKAGVLAGDIIYAIDDEEVWDKTTEVIASKLRGPANTKVKLTVVRDSRPLDFELTREKINNVSADISYYTEKENDKSTVAIISVYRFSSDTGSLVASFANEIKSKNVSKIILDLRNNGGGYVSAAKELLSLWLDGDKILIQRSRHSGESNTYASRGQNIFANMETVVLINGSTASASEIVAGALKDYNKATLIGETTFGKGVVQTMLTIRPDDLLKITTAHWYTPNGTSINGTGIKPDREVERTFDQINKNIDPQLDAAKALLQDK